MRNDARRFIASSEIAIKEVRRGGALELTLVLY